MISNKIMLEAAAEFGTPLFLYDIDKIKEKADHCIYSYKELLK